MGFFDLTDPSNPIAYAVYRDVTRDDEDDEDDEDDC